MIFLLCVFLINGQTLFVPLAFAILLSILLLPVTNFLENKASLPKSIANLVSIMFALGIIVGIIYFFSQQIATFLNDIPSIRAHLNEHYRTLQHWIQQRFDITAKQQTVMIANATAEVKTSGTEMIGETFFTITHTIFYIIMVAIYSFLILHYRHMIRKFLIALFNKAHEPQIIEVLQESKGIVQKYMLGLILEMGIVAVANSAILLLIGVKYAVFLGIFSAILNIIPYVGILAGIIFTSLVTLTTSPHLSDIVYVIISFEVVHFIDSNFLMPRIVGSRVKINALVTIIGVVLGGTLVGLSGIFLALPTIAILKIIFDRIEDLKPWGMLMGDDTESKKGRLLRQLEKIRLRRKKTLITTVENTPSDSI
ncbi:MAG TPA: AI-2E family transporter [Ferruginibacter sp.]|nr:AI-2E family transporter [Ferruginibacter sp.]